MQMKNKKNSPLKNLKIQFCLYIITLSTSRNNCDFFDCQVFAMPPCYCPAVALLTLGCSHSWGIDSMLLPCRFHGISMPFHAVAMLFLCCCPANTMSLPCHTVSVTTLFPCRCHVVAMLLPCRYHANTMPLPRSSHANFILLPCCCHAIAMLLPCHCHAVAIPLPCQYHAVATL